MDGQGQQIQCERFRRLVVGYRWGLLDQLGEQHVLGCRDCIDWLRRELPHRDFLGLLGSDDKQFQVQIRALVFERKANTVTRDRKRGA